MMLEERDKAQKDHGMGYVRARNEEEVKRS